MAETIKIAIAGNPNSGKTTIFNSLTGAHQQVGNYPGITVEKKSGIIQRAEETIEIIDLPGVYSLSPYSEEEVVTRNFIIEEKPDVVIDIVDASNIERNLYLTTQLKELKVPIVIALNMSDLAKSRGIEFDLQQFSKLIGFPIIPTIGNKGTGVEELLQTAVKVAMEAKGFRGKNINFGREIEAEIGKLSGLLLHRSMLPENYLPRWVAIKLLEQDDDIIERLSLHEIMSDAEKSRSHLKTIFGDEPQVIIAERRYGFISGACQEAVKSTVEIRHTISDEIDRVITSRLLGIPIFLLMMWLVFHLTFTIGSIPMNWMEAAIGWLGSAVESAMPEGILRFLLVDGIIGGVGGILVFVPIIMLLFMAISLLEDSGYMARAAFIMDRTMHKIGLHGKSFVPMLIGFGCTVPAVMATRTLETRRDRMVTMLVVPLMSCGARLPVYTLFVGAFFAESAGGYVMFSLYFLGIVVAVLLAKLFRTFLFRGPTTPLVMELPPYRIPTPEGILIHMWERSWLFIKRALTVLMAISILMWFLSNFPSESVEQGQMQDSYAGRVGGVVAVPLKPIGLGNWKIGTALFAGLVAKEVVVTTLGTLYNVQDEDKDENFHNLRKSIQNDPTLSPLKGFVLMVFVLMYLPCAATFVAIWRETNSLKWPLFTATYLTVLAWITCFIIYRGGILLGLDS